jgi:hypothetical protein
VPPAVALLKYISSSLFWRIFSQTEILAGFSLHIINLAVRISAAMMAGEIIFFRVPNSLQGCDGWGEGWEILYIKASLVQWKDIRLWQPVFGPAENHFVSGNFAGFSLYISSEGTAKLRWVGRVEV